MKKILINIGAIAMIAILIAPGCTKKIDEAYYNPNADVKVPVEQILPPLISCMGANSAGHGPLNDFRFFGKYIQYWQFCNAGDMYDRMSGRLVPLGSTQADMTASIFRVHYYDIGQNLVNMMKWSEEEKKWDYAGIGKAISAWSWLTLTDVQGELILKQAFDQSRLVFDYDSQEEVYAFVKQQCYDALGYLNKSGDNMNPANLAVSDAYMFGGDLNKWKKFVYGILARAHNHLSNKSIYKADSVIHYANLSMASNADNAMVKFAGVISGSSNFFGPLRNNLSSVVDGTNTAIRQSAYIANLLSGANSAFTGVADPRAIYLIRKNANGTFKGLQPNKGNAGITVANDRPENFFGVAQTTAVNNVAPSNDNNCRYLFRNTAPVPVMTASEILFMKAEAAYRKGDKTTALAAYTQAISLNFDMLLNDYNTNVPVGEVITPANKAAYLTSTTVVPASAASLTLNKIMLQKYIALYGWGVGETWVDMRRFHYTDSESGVQVYTDFVAPTGTDLHPNNGGKLVYRTYPRYNSETVWNIESLKKIGADKDDFHTYECWFSKP
jgi:tetratricopeptide (TPR) repeat protein